MLPCFFYIFANVQQFQNMNSGISDHDDRKTHDPYQKESKEQYWDRVNRSVRELEEGKGIIFTIDELKKHLLQDDAI